MLKRLLLVATSAVCLAGLAGVGLAALAAAEADILAATRRTLQTEVAAVEATWRRNGAEVSQLAVATAGDASLGKDVHALVAAVDIYNPDSKLANALALRIDGLRSHLSERLLQLRHINPEVESVALMSTDGLVLAANSPRWHVGQSILPTPEHADVAPLPEFLLKGLTGTSQSGIWVENNTVWWVSVAPIWWAPAAGRDASSGPTLAGVTLLEQPLRSLPESAGATAFLMLDNNPLLGTPPRNMRALPPTPEPFLLASRTAQATLFGQTFALKPFFINPGHVGIWAQRLHVPGTDRVHGAVTTDLTDVYSRLATRQLQLMMVALVAWAVIASMLARRGWHLEHDVHRISEFLVAVAHGNSQRQIDETQLGREAHRLGLVLNQVLAMPAAKAVARALPEEEELVAEAEEDDAPLDLNAMPFANVPTASAGAKVQPPVAAPNPIDVAPAPPPAEPAFEDLAARPVLGDLADTVPAPPEPEPEPAWTPPAAAPEPSRRFLREDEDTNPLFQRPDLGPDDDETSSPMHRPSAFSAAAPILPLVAEAPPSARDQLMALLQAKAKGHAEIALEPEPAFAAPGVTEAPWAAEPLDLPQSEPPAQELELASPAAAVPDAQAPQPEPPLPLEPPPPEEPMALLDLDTGPAVAEDPMRVIFDDFVRLRAECGEAGELPYDKFVARLATTRADVIAKHNCQDVLFSAYIKNGKAALKVTPR